MAISGSVSIPSAVGRTTVFTVYGARTLGLAQQFQARLGAALQASNLNLAQGHAGQDSITAFANPVAGRLNEAVFSPNQTGGIGIGDTATVPAGYQYLFDNVNGPTTVQGPAAGIHGIFEGDGSAATFIDGGGNNTIVFVNGDNHFEGDMAYTAGSETIAGGTGFDTIDAGYGSAVVYAGVGRGDITLNDTKAGAPSNTNFNDYAYLADGKSTVHANGRLDAVLASAAGQVIYGGASASDFTAAVLLPNDTGGAAGNDLVYGDAATIAAFDESTGNTVLGGTGKLLFIGGNNVAATLEGGTGVNYGFGANGDTLTWTTPVQGTANAFVGGVGSETLNAAGATGPLAIYAYSAGAGSVNAQVNDLFTGGAGNDTLVSGGGHETLNGGAGNNVFVIDKSPDGQGAQITLGDFAASSGNIITFANYTTAEIDAALAGAHTVTGTLGTVETVFTLSDNTTVTVVGLSSLTGHIFGG